MILPWFLATGNGWVGRRSVNDDEDVMRSCVNILDKLGHAGAGPVRHATDNQEGPPSL